MQQIRVHSSVVLSSTETDDGMSRSLVFDHLCCRFYLILGLRDLASQSAESRNWKRPSLSFRCKNWLPSAWSCRLLTHPPSCCTLMRFCTVSKAVGRYTPPQCVWREVSSQSVHVCNYLATFSLSHCCAKLVPRPLRPLIDIRLILIDLCLIII